LFLQAKGISSHGDATTGGGAPQDACTRGVINVEVFALRACVPTGEVIQEIIGKRSCDAVVGAAGDVVPAVVAAGVNPRRLVGTGGAAGCYSTEAII
jgi:hypothetical protein